MQVRSRHEDIVTGNGVLHDVAKERHDETEVGATGPLARKVSVLCEMSVERVRLAFGPALDQRRGFGGEPRLRQKRTDRVRDLVGERVLEGLRKAGEKALAELLAPPWVMFRARPARPLIRRQPEFTTPGVAEHRKQRVHRIGR